MQKHYDACHTMIFWLLYVCIFILFRLQWTSWQNG